MASCLAVESPRTANAGWPAGAASSCRCAFCHACSGGASSRSWRSYIAVELRFFGEHKSLAAAGAFGRWLAPLRSCEWVVYAKRPFAGPEAVLAYLSRYTHRVAISNRRLVSMDENGVTFRWKDYRPSAPVTRR